MVNKAPYRAVSIGNSPYDDDDAHYTDNTSSGSRIVQTQSLDSDLDMEESSNNEKSIKYKLLLSTCLLGILAFGGRTYYIKNYGNNNDDDGKSGNLIGSSLIDGGKKDFGSSSSSADSNTNGIRGSSKDYDWGNNNNDDLVDLADELLNEEGYEGGMILVPEDDDEGTYDEGGEEMYQGDLDDEIDNGEVAGNFDTDIYDDDGYYYEEGEEGEEIIIDDEEEEGGELEYVDNENSEDRYVDNTEEEDMGPSGDEEGEEDEEEDLTNISQEEDDDEDVVVEDEEDSPEPPQVDEESEEEGGGLPDYFVPLTPPEREQMKNRLRATLSETKNALLFSANIKSAPEDRPVHPLPQRTLVLDAEAPKQFMHMHHMKTGGTSVDGLISCALRRQRELHNGNSISYSSMSECGSRVKTCMDDLAKQLNASVVDNVFYRNDAQGEAQVDAQFSFDPADETHDALNVCTTSEANVMSYCASLHAVRTFGWKTVDKITVIRNPIDRAWSMYKYSLNRCYKCQEMKDVLRQVANGTFSKGGDGGDTQTFAYSPNDSCAVQMIGHQATNLLSSIDLYNVANDVRFPREKEIVDEAVHNLRWEFTWIGITDRIQESIDGMRTVFPFLAENLVDTASTLQDLFQDGGKHVEDGRFSLPEGYKDEQGCPFEHRNGSRDPTCGTTEMDEETISLIQRLNNRDVAVYKAAVERFELQNEVLQEYQNGSI